METLKKHFGKILCMILLYYTIPPKGLEEKLALTVGFVIKETKKHILLANTIDGHMSNGRLQIPKAMIRQVEVLKEKGP